MASVAGQVAGVAEQVTGGCWVSYSGGEQVTGDSGQFTGQVAEHVTGLWITTGKL